MVFRNQHGALHSRRLSGKLILLAGRSIASRGALLCRILAQPIAVASPLAAAAANGVAAHVLEFDDTIYDGIAHASEPVLPALPAAETSQATGTDVNALCGGVGRTLS